MVNRSGSVEGLEAHRQASQRATRLELELALARLQNGNPIRVKRGTRLTPSSVAAEADVDRSTLYRYHEPILTEIRKLIDAVPKALLIAKRAELVQAENKARSYRQMIAELQAEMTAWARQNYDLTHRVQDLEVALQQRDKHIAELRARLVEGGKVITLRAS